MAEDVAEELVPRCSNDKPRVLRETENLDPTGPLPWVRKLLSPELPGWSSDQEPGQHYAAVLPVE